MHPVVVLAARQHGVVTTSQLLDAGVSRRAIARRVEAGWLVPLYRGVFQVGPVAAPFGSESAALLAVGGDAALSHQSAAALWGFAKRPPEVHVTTTSRGRRSRQGLRVHHSASLNAAVHDGLPLTTPARTLSDLSRVLTPSELDRATEQAEILDLVERSATSDGFTRSDAERRLKALCRKARLPMPRTNARVAGYEVDFYWPAARLVVEVDGYRYHRTREAFERDRRKDAALTAALYRVVRITWRRIVEAPYEVVALLATLLTPA